MQMEKQIPKTESGRFILVATVDVADGKMDRFLELARPVMDLAKSDKEPKTHTYRVTRSETQVVIFEEYEGEEGFNAHVSGAPFQGLVKAGEEEKLWTKLDMNFLREL